MAQRKQKLNTIFGAFGVKGKKFWNRQEKKFKKEQRQDRKAALQPGETLKDLPKPKQFKKKSVGVKDVYQKLSKKTGKKPGGDFLNFATSGGRSKLFKKAEKKYERKYGLPGIDRLKDIEQKSQEAAAKYYAPEQENNQAYYDTLRQRNNEDYTQNEQDALRQLGYTNEDIARMREQSAREYQQSLQENTLQSQLEGENLTANLNATGQLDSSLQGLKTGRLHTQQENRLRDINEGYTDYTTGLDTQARRAQEGSNYYLQQYQRNRDRQNYDIDQMEKERQLNFDRAQQGYATGYMGDILGNISQKSQNYYDNQAYNDNQASNYLEDLYNVEQ